MIKPDVKNLPINNLVPIYLMSSYIYYEKDDNVLEDHEFNLVCKRLYNNFDNITHMHKYLLSKEELKASTGYTLKYTNLIKQSAMIWLQKYKDNRKNINALKYTPTIPTYKYI